MITSALIHATCSVLCVCVFRVSQIQKPRPPNLRRAVTDALRCRGGCGTRQHCSLTRHFHTQVRDHPGNRDVTFSTAKDVAQWTGQVSLRGVSNFSEGFCP